MKTFITIIMSLCVLSCHKEKSKEKPKVNVGPLRFVEEVEKTEDYVVITPEMESILKDDPVYQFMQRVNAAATKNPKWNKDYTLAHYEAFVDEFQKYTMELLRSKGLIKGAP
jgi:hypothetical protein